MRGSDKMSENRDNKINKTVINWDIGIYRQLTSNTYEIRKNQK